ncbi:MAG: hypothetical protein H6587_05605 [Flavobacteriales bacterium]|nr:hypothetical protein [Flavobacteriales bacterium]MCB9364026.1 hypothetical protein [Flavobacteriales bacterium]
MENQNLNTQQALPNSTGVLVLGILSIVFCFCYGIVGTILGIIGIVMASKANKIYLSSPENYTESSYKNMKAGRVCAIIGTCISGLYLLIMLVYIAFFGALLTSMPWEQMLNQ